MKTYELSISPNYVTDWSVNDAIREILQNAIDSEKMGNKKEIYYKNNTLFISNENVELSESTLVLGCGDKTGDESLIGGYCEGYKLALVVLLRENHQVRITNRNTVWNPRFGISSQFNTEVLMVDIKESSYSNKLIFVISGININLYNSLLDDFPCIDNDFGDTIKTKHGDILLENKYAGKFYVEGLYVDRDNSFNVGYNFNANEVELDRDRRSINYYELIELTTKASLTAEECDDVIYKNITSAAIDTKYITEVLDEASDSFIDDFRKKYYKKENIGEDVVVTTREVCEELSNKGYKVKETSKNVAALLNKGTDKAVIINNAEERIASRTKIQEAWESFERSEYRWLLKWLYSLKEDIPEFKFNQFYKRYIENFNSLDYNLRSRYLKEIIDDITSNLPYSLETEYIEGKLL